MVSTKLGFDGSFEMVANENVWFVTDSDNKLIASKIGTTLEFFNIAVAENDFSTLQEVANVVQAVGRTRKKYFVIDFDYLCVECTKDSVENIADALIGIFEGLTIHY